MFATLAGGYPAADPTAPAPSPSAADELVREILAQQAAAGLGLLTDGSVRWPDPVAAIGGALLGGDRGGSALPLWSGPITVANSTQIGFEQANEDGRHESPSDHRE